MIIHGHRGFRGKFPENALRGFREAHLLNVDALELDVVVSKDMQLIVNHDPWLKSGEYMINKTGEVPEKAVNLYEHNFEDIQRFVLGTKTKFNFPEQIPCPHPVYSLQACVEDNQLANAFWNIEIKSEMPWYGVYQPQPSVYAKLVHDFILTHKLHHRCLVQCFDPVFLNELHQYQPIYPLGLLVENELSLEENLAKLHFTPSFYNPDEVLVTEELIQQIHKKNMQCLIWTVNEVARAKELTSWGANGIITDYPNLFKC